MLAGRPFEPAKLLKNEATQGLTRNRLAVTNMTQTITLELPWPPTGNHATKHTRTGGHYKTAETVAYRAAVLRLLAGMGLGKGQARKTSLRPLAGPLKASWVIAPPDHRARDLDNVRKEAADALTLAGLWVDDSCKVLRQETFEWVPPEPGGKVLLTVETLGNCTGVQSGENDSKKRA